MLFALEARFGDDGRARDISAGADRRRHFRDINYQLTAAPLHASAYRAKRKMLYSMLKFDSKCLPTLAEVIGFGAAELTPSLKSRAGAEPPPGVDIVDIFQLGIRAARSSSRQAIASPHVLLSLPRYVPLSNYHWALLMTLDDKLSQFRCLPRHFSAAQEERQGEKREQSRRHEVRQSMF